MLHVSLSYKILLLCLCLTAGLLVLAPVSFVTATNDPSPVDPRSSVDITGKAAGIKTNETLPDMIGRVIGALLVILGTIFLLLVIYGGFLWMTSAGNQTQIEKAKSLIVAAIVGLVIVTISFLVTQLIYIVFK